MEPTFVVCRSLYVKNFERRRGIVEIAIVKVFCFSTRLFLERRSNASGRRRGSTDNEGNRRKSESDAAKDLNSDENRAPRRPRYGKVYVCV